MLNKKAQQQMDKHRDLKLKDIFSDGTYQSFDIDGETKPDKCHHCGSNNNNSSLECIFYDEEVFVVIKQYDHSEKKLMFSIKNLNRGIDDEGLVNFVVREGLDVIDECLSINHISYLQLGRYLVYFKNDKNAPNRFELYHIDLLDLTQGEVKSCNVGITIAESIEKEPISVIFPLPIQYTVDITSRDSDIVSHVDFIKKLNVLIFLKNSQNEGAFVIQQVGMNQQIQHQITKFDDHEHVFFTECSTFHFGSQDLKREYSAFYRVYYSDSSIWQGDHFFYRIPNNNQLKKFDEKDPDLEVVKSELKNEMYKIKQSTLQWLYTIQYEDSKRQTLVSCVTTENIVFRTLFNIREFIAGQISANNRARKFDRKDLNSGRLENFRCCLIKDQLHHQIFIVVQMDSSSVDIIRLEEFPNNRRESLLSDFPAGKIQNKLIQARLMKDQNQTSPIIVSIKDDLSYMRNNKGSYQFTNNKIGKISNNAQYTDPSTKNEWCNIRFFRINQDFVDEYKHNGFYKGEFHRDEIQKSQTMYVRIQDDQKREITNLFVKPKTPDQDHQEFSIIVNKDFNVNKHKSQSAHMIALPIQVIENPSKNDPFWDTKINPLKIKTQRAFKLQDQMEFPETTKYVPLLAIQRDEQNLSVTKRIFICILDTVKKKIMDAHQIELQDKELEQYHDSFLNISSDVDDRNLEHIKQNYQVCIQFKPELKTIKIFEYEITWNVGSSEINCSDIDLKGTKILIEKMDDDPQENEDEEEQLTSIDFLPLFDNDNSEIIGTQLIIQTPQADRIISLENLEEFQYSNFFAFLGYQVYNREFIGGSKFLLVETQLRLKVHDQKYTNSDEHDECSDNKKMFNEYDKNQMVLMLERALLNTVTFELQKYLWSGHEINVNSFNYFTNLEIIGGLQLCQFHIQNPQTIQQEYDRSLKEESENLNLSKNVRRSNQYYKSLLQIVLESDKNSDRVQFFEEIGLMDQLIPDLQKLETLVDFCCQRKEPNIQTLDILFQKLMSETFSFSRYNNCLSFLTQVDNYNISEIPKSFYEFLSESKDNYSMTLERSFQDESLPSAQPQALKKFEIQPDGETVCTSEIREYLSQYISQVFLRGSTHQVEYHYIDFRFLIFKKKLANFITDQKNEIGSFDKVEIDELMIAKSINRLIVMNPEILETSRVLRNIIKEQFDRTTFKSFFSHAIAFSILAAVPFLITIVIEEQQQEYMKYVNALFSFITLITLLYFELIEIIQIKSAPRIMEHFKSVYNIYDQIIFFLYLIIFLNRVSHGFESQVAKLPEINEKTNNTVSTESKAVSLNNTSLNLTSFQNGTDSTQPSVDSNSTQQSNSSIDSNQTTPQNISVNASSVFTKPGSTDSIPILYDENGVQLITWDIMQAYNDTIFIRLITSMTLMLGFLKIISYTRLFRIWGIQAYLIGQSCLDVIPFVVYFIILICAFSIQLGEVGATFDAEDYSELPEYVVLLMQTYRNGIGDIAAPDYSYWSNAQVKGYEVNKLLVGYIWFGWISCQFFILIIMLNFIISVIGQTYERISGQITILRYQYMAQFNEELREVQNFFEKKNYEYLQWLQDVIPRIEKYECLIYQSIRVDIENTKTSQDEWQGQVSAIRKIMKEETKKVNGRIDELAGKIFEKLDAIEKSQQQRSTQKMQAMVAQSSVFFKERSKKQKNCKSLKSVKLKLPRIGQSIRSESVIEEVIEEDPMDDVVEESIGSHRYNRALTPIKEQYKKTLSMRLEQK